MVLHNLISLFCSFDIDSARANVSTLRHVLFNSIVDIMSFWQFQDVYLSSVFLIVFHLFVVDFLTSWNSYFSYS